MSTPVDTVTPPSHPDELVRLAEELEAAAPGREVWRVALPDGAYCLEFDHSDSVNPRRECEEWMAQRAEYCAERGYSVQRARSYTQSERACREVADRLRQIAACAGAEPAQET